MDDNLFHGFGLSIQLLTGRRRFFSACSRLLGNPLHFRHGLGRERTFFVNKELTDIDDMLAGIMRYKKGASSPYHLHANCEHFHFIFESQGTVESAEGIRKVGPGDMIFIPAEDKDRLRATESPLFYFEFQAPNRFKTTILDGTPDDLVWNRVDGKVWLQS